MGKHEGGFHRESRSGDFVTANNTSDSRYPDGSYYVSYGNQDDGHVTMIYDANGDQTGGDS